jgi:signal peptidase II
MMIDRLRLTLPIAGLVVFFDQLSKIFIDRSFTLYESLEVVENFFHITYVRNKGAAFGLFADSAFRVPFFIGVALLAVVGILWYLRQVEDDQRAQQIGLSLVLGGALGNLVDRVRLGEVIDFLDVHWYRHHWPAFNVADIAICVGVGLLLLGLWQAERQAKRA